MPRGWYFDRKKHSLASKGIRTKTRQGNFNFKLYSRGQPDYENMSIQSRIDYLEDTAEQWLRKYGEHYEEVNPAEFKYVMDILDLIENIKGGYENPLVDAQDELDEDKIPVIIIPERKGGMVKEDDVWIIDTRVLEFGSVLWQDAMLENLGRKYEAGIEINSRDKIFLDMQKSHQFEMLKEAKRSGKKLSDFQEIVFRQWEAEEL